MRPIAKALDIAQSDKVERRLRLRRQQQYARSDDGVTKGSVSRK